MTALPPQEVELRLKHLAGWRFEAGELVRVFRFPDFRAALRFVNSVGELAEMAGHHPDIFIRYNRVRLGLVSHDAGGITEKDLGLARGINNLS